MPNIVRTALLTINQFESGAVDDHLSSLGWQREASPIPRSRYAFGWQTTLWVNPTDGSEIHHAAMRMSGNITALMVVTETFLRTEVEYDYFVLFGCAGVIPTSNLRVGDTVLVSSATYAENGRAYHGELGGVGTTANVEAVGIKQAKLLGFSIELADGALYSLKHGLVGTGRGATTGLPVAKALCVDKVLQVKDFPPLHNGQKKTELTYSELVATNDYHIVDMESFGFLWALEEYKQNCIVLRVLTDELGDHSASTRAVGGLIGQEELLRENVHYLTDAVSHLARLSQGQAEQVFRVADELEDVLPVDVSASEVTESAWDRFLNHTRIWFGNWSVRRNRALQIDNYLRTLASMRGLAEAELTSSSAPALYFSLIQNLRYAGRTGYLFSSGFDSREFLSADEMIDEIATLLVQFDGEVWVNRENQVLAKDFVKDVLRRVTPSSSDENFRRLLRSFGRNHGIGDLKVAEHNGSRKARTAMVATSNKEVEVRSTDMGSARNGTLPYVVWNGGHDDGELLRRLGRS